MEACQYKIIQICTYNTEHSNLIFHRQTALSSTVSRYFFWTAVVRKFNMPATQLWDLKWTKKSREKQL